MLSSLKNSRIIRGFVATLLGSGASKLILVIATFYCTNKLSQLGFGEFSFIRNTLNTILCICALNFTSLCTKFTAEAYKDFRSYFKLAILFIFSLAICVVTGVVLLFLTDDQLEAIIGSRNIVPYFRIIGALLPVFLLQPLIEGVLRGIMKFKLIGILQTASSLCFFVFVAIGIHIDGVGGAIIGMLCYYLLYSLLSIAVLVKQVRLMRILRFSLNFKKHDLTVLGTMIVPVFLMSFVEAPINWWAQVLLVKYDTMASVGAMTAILQIRNLLMLIPSYFFSTFMAFAAKMRAEGDMMNYFSKFDRIGIYIFLASIFMLLIFAFLGEFLLSLYGKEYVSSHFALIIALVALPLMLLSNLLKINMVVMEKQRLILLISIIWNLGFIAALYALLNNNIDGTQAYYYAQGIGIILMFVISFYYYLKDKRRYYEKV